MTYILTAMPHMSLGIVIAVTLVAGALIDWRAAWSRRYPNGLTRSVKRSVKYRLEKWPGGAILVWTYRRVMSWFEWCWQELLLGIRILAGRLHWSALARLANRRLNPMALKQFEIGSGHFENGDLIKAKAAFDRGLKLSDDPLAESYRLWMTLVARGEMALGLGYYHLHRKLQKDLGSAVPAGSPPLRYLRDFWTNRIGHLAHIDCYLKIGMLKWRPAQETIILTQPESVANSTYLQYWTSYVPVICDAQRFRALAPVARYVEDYKSVNELDGRCLWDPIAGATVQRQWQKEKRPPLLKLTDEDRAWGEQVLHQLGVPRDAWFVGLHVRSAGFWGKDDCIQDFRNAELESYREAIRIVRERGGFVIRMGGPSMPPAPAIDGLIDYAHSPLRSERMDIFLCAACRFFIGTQSGLSLVPYTFGVPSFMTNWATLSTPPWYGGDLFLPKLFWSEEKCRCLTLDEMFASRCSWTQYMPDFKADGLRLVDNSADDLAMGLEEMLDLLEGRECDAEVRALRQRFEKLAESRNVLVVSKISGRFLRKHAQELW